MSPDLISIIVPCYKQAEFLDECLQSVLDQTYPEWECLIIDDGSPDDTEIIVKKWTQKDARFTYFKKDNGGVASARNFGIAKAQGKWILPLDADDKIGKEYLKLTAEKLKEGYDVVYCLAEFFGLKNEPYFIKKHTYHDLLQNNTIFCSAIFNKEKMSGARYDENLIDGFEDWEFWISYLAQPDKKVFRLEETLFFYRIKERSRNEDINRDEEKLQAAKKYIFYKHREKYEKHFGNYFHLLQENSLLKTENRKLAKIFNSKRHQMVEKICKFFNK